MDDRVGKCHCESIIVAIKIKGNLIWVWYNLLYFIDHGFGDQRICKKHNVTKMKKLKERV